MNSPNHHHATSPEDRNWQGDMQQPMGATDKVCPTCGLDFKGFPRRIMCRACKKLKLMFPSLFKREVVQ